jgi:hypothetical protein
MEKSKREIAEAARAAFMDPLANPCVIGSYYTAMRKDLEALFEEYGATKPEISKAIICFLRREKIPLNL